MKKTLFLATLVGAALMVAPAFASEDIVLNAGESYNIDGNFGSAFSVTLGNEAKIYNETTSKGENQVQIGSLTITAAEEGQDPTTGIVQVNDNTTYAIINSSWNEATLTLNGGTLSKQGNGTFQMVHTTASDAGNINVEAGTLKIGCVHNTNGLNANQATLKIFNGATLDITKTSSSGTLNNAGTSLIKENSSASKLVMDGGTLTINSGKTMTINADNANMVLLTGCKVNGGGKLFINAGKYSGNTTIDLSTVAEGTTISLKQAKGTLKAATNNIVAANIELTNGDWAAAEWTTVEGSAYTFTGAISGSGNFAISQNKTVALTFSGDLSSWTSGSDQWSGLRVNNSATVNAVLNGTLTNAAVGTAFNRGGGKLNLTIDRNATLSNRLDLTSLTVNAGKMVSTSDSFFKTAEKVELGAGASLTINNANATDTNVGTFVGLGDNAHLTLSGTTNLKVTDSSSAQGVWINENADVTIQGSAQINVANGALTISKVDGTEDAKISRLNAKATAKLGVTKNSDSSPVFLKNVAVSNAIVNYEGSDILYLGKMNGGNLNAYGHNIEFAEEASFIGTLELNGNSITLGTAASHNATLTLNNLMVTAADSAINADLVLNNGGTITMSHAVTMGCSVTIGNSETLVLTNADYTDNVLQNYILFTGVDSLTLGSGDPVAQGWYDASTVLSSLSINGGEAITSNLDNFVIGYWNGTVSISDKSVPEPSTATLSLLALAGLAARRRRH